MCLVLKVDVVYSKDALMLSVVYVHKFIDKSSNKITINFFFY